MAMAVSVVEANQRQRANRKGMEAELYNGAMNGSLEVVFQYNWLEHTTPVENNILHVHVAKPKETVSIDFMQVIVNHDAGYSLLWKQNANGDTPLHLAARFGQTGAVRVLLGRIAATNQGEVVRILSIVNNKKDIALHEAARAGHPGVVKLLVQAATPNELLQIPNDMDETPVYLAAEFGCGEAVMSILNYCHPSTLFLDHKGPCGRTPLHAAALCLTGAASEIIHKMMEIDRSAIRVQDDQGLTPLHCAAMWKWALKPLQALLDYNDEANSAMYIQDNEGRTALHLAAQNGNWEGMKLLLNCCPDSVEMVDNKGQNVVHHAVTLGCLKQVEYLLGLGYMDKLLNEKDVNGNTPLHLLAATVPHIQAHRCFYRIRDFIRGNPVSTSAFNNQNLTVADILTSNSDLRVHYVPFVDWSLIIPPGRRVWIHGSHKNARAEESVGDGMEKAVLDVKQKAQNHLVVATLITTVSFTAGFTIPGGFIQNPGKEFGMAVLAQNTGFKAFLISDTVAFTSSALAVICYLLLAKRSGLVLVEILYSLGYLLTTLSLCSMGIAFFTGVYAVISTTHSIAIAVFALSLLFFLPFLFLFYGYYTHAMFFMNRCTKRVPKRLGPPIFTFLNKLCP